MALLLKNNVMFLHAPKTGGNWVRNLLRRHDRIAEAIEHKHATYEIVSGHLRAKTGKTKPTVFLVTVRNPLTWYESCYRYQAWRKFQDWGKAGDPALWHPLAPLNGIAEPDFNAFLNAIHDRRPGYLTALYASYTGQSNALLMHTETLRDDLAAMNARLDLGLPDKAIRNAPDRNVSPPRPIVWRRDTLARTIELERAAFVAYGYDWHNTVVTE